MPLKLLETLLGSERRSHLLLVNAAWRHSRRFCVRCRSFKIYRLADKRYRCAQCGYTFHDFTRRWIGELNLTARQWLWVVKLFELEIAPAQMAKEVGISYPTALKAIGLIRRAIAQASGVMNTFPDTVPGTSMDVRTGDGPSRTFAVIETAGRIAITPIEDVTVRQVLEAQARVYKQATVLFTGPFRNYDGLILWRHRIAASAVSRFGGGTRQHPGGVDAFWIFARRHFSKFHGTSDADFFFFLNELVFRYEHRERELFDMLVGLVTHLMPDF